MNRLARFVALVALPLLAVVPSHAQSDLQPVPKSREFIADVAGVLHVDEYARIATSLKKLNQDRGSQLGIVIVNETEPESIEDFAQRVFTTWKLGRKGVDDGALMVIAVNNKTRRMRIHTGYGLEGALPDVTVKRILAEQMRPALEKSGPAAAVSVGVNELLARINAYDMPAKSDITMSPVLESMKRLFIGTAAHLPLMLIAGWCFCGAADRRRKCFRWLMRWSTQAWCP